MQVLFDYAVEWTRRQRLGDHLGVHFSWEMYTSEPEFASEIDMLPELEVNPAKTNLSSRFRPENLTAARQ